MVVLGAAISLDGYVARPNGSVDFLDSPAASDPEAMRGMAAFWNTIDTAVFGRKTLDVAVALGGGRYDSHGLATTYVLSRTQPPGERDGVIFTNQTPQELVAGLRSHPGKDIYVMGGGEIARAFLADDVVDEIHLMLMPVLLGQGIPFFPPAFPERTFALLETKGYPGGAVSLKYRCVRD
jgi:dihydrofolate reductase